MKLPLASMVIQTEKPPTVNSHLPACGTGTLMLLQSGRQLLLAALSWAFLRVCDFFLVRAI